MRYGLFYHNVSWLLLEDGESVFKNTGSLDYQPIMVSFIEVLLSWMSCEHTSKSLDHCIGSSVIRKSHISIVNVSSEEFDKLLTYLL